MTLYIDTTDFNAVKFVLAEGGSTRTVIRTVNPHESHETLAVLENFLNKTSRSKTHIKNIVVNKGPGSFTGTRIGVTHALALGFAWDVPVKFLETKKFSAVLKKVLAE